MKKYCLCIIISFLLLSCEFPWSKKISMSLSYGSTRVVNASWYGPKFHGKRTASGEIFNMNAMTCAHKTLPFGTELKVTNLATNRSVKVIVNDRGPFIRGRELDLSYGAAKRIGLYNRGLGKVRMKYLGRIRGYKKVIKDDHSPAGPYTIQVGSFKNSSNAKRLLTALSYRHSGVYITHFNLKGVRFYRVRLGKYRYKKEALKRAKKLAHEGYPVLITRLQ
jgi:rare lipoprotein A